MHPTRHWGRGGSGGINGVRGKGGGGIHWKIISVLLLRKDSSSLMSLRIFSPAGDFRVCRMDQQSARKTVLVGSLSSWCRVWNLRSKGLILTLLFSHVWFCLCVVFVGMSTFDSRSFVGPSGSKF